MSSPDDYGHFLHGPAVDQVLAVDVSTNPGGQWLWLLSDQQNSVRDVVDTYQNVLDRINYDSFGRVISETDAAAGADVIFGYTGREFDDETGLQYNRARYYDPNVGRFISADPTGFGGGDYNLYRYTGNSPLLHTDPSGLSSYSSPSIWSSVGSGLGQVASTASGLWSGFTSGMNNVLAGTNSAGFGSSGQILLGPAPTPQWRIEDDRAIAINNAIASGTMKPIEGFSLIDAFNSGMPRPDQYGPDPVMEFLYSVGSGLKDAGTSLLNLPSNVAYGLKELGAGAVDTLTGTFEFGLNGASGLMGSNASFSFPTISDTASHITSSYQDGSSFVAVEGMSAANVLTSGQASGIAHYIETGDASPWRQSAFTTLYLAGAAKGLNTALKQAGAATPSSGTTSANSRPMFTSDWQQLLAERYGAENVQLVSPRNPILGLPRVGSALKPDPFHSFPNVVDNFASGATPTALPNAALYQLEGGLGSPAGRFEWIVQDGNVTHRYFVPGGKVNGVPIKP